MLRKLLFTILMMISFSSCTPGVADDSARTSTLSNYPISVSLTPRPSPLNTATLTPRPTIRPTFTATNTATITLSPTITNTPGPLTETGPWIILHQNENEPGKKSQYWVMNLDGSGLQPLQLPAIPDDREWQIVATSSWPVLAVRTKTLLGDNPTDIRQDGIDDQVWVISLPDMNIIRKIPLLNKAAWDFVWKVSKESSNGFNSGLEIPTQLGLTINPESFLFSPHGQYLAYSASTGSSGTDLYLYDTVKNEIRQLTKGKTGAQVWFWSPDDKTVIYRNGETTSAAYYLPELNQMTGVYAYNLFSGERKLYDPETWEAIISVSNQDFLVADFGFETLPWNLRSVNFKTGLIQQIYENTFTDAAFDDTNRVLMLLFDPNAPFAGGYTKVDPGIYRYDNAAKKLVFIREGDSIIRYDKNTGFFQTDQKSGNLLGDTILFDLSGKEVLRFQGQWHIYISPDGQWILAGNDESYYKLYTSQGIVQKDIGPAYNITWLNDSSGFLIAHEGISILKRDNNWEPQEIYNSDCCSFTLVPSDSSK